MALILDKQAVLASLDLSSLVDDVAAGMVALSRGEAEQPLRTRVFSRQTGGLLASLPCYLASEELFSVKIGYSHPTLRSPDGTRHLTQVITFGDTEGRLLAIMHGTELGMYRTAACSAAAARCLTREDAAHLAVIGGGPMGQAEAIVMASVRPLTRITAYDTNPEAAARLRDAVEAATGITVTLCSSAEAAVEGADIVSLATTSHDPVIRHEWLRPDAHVAALGAHRKDHREADSDTVAAARMVIESHEALMAEAGDYLVPLSEGRLAHDYPLIELGALLSGEAGIADAAERLTLFKSTGVGVQDLVIARHVYDRARAAGRGVELEF